MPIISYVIQAIILQHMFVNKGKINTSRFCSCIVRNLKKNINVIWQTLFLVKPSPFCLAPPFLAKISRTPHFHKVLKSQTPLPPFMKRGGERI